MKINTKFFKFTSLILAIFGLITSFFASLEANLTVLPILLILIFLSFIGEMISERLDKLIELVERSQSFVQSTDDIL